MTPIFAKACTVAACLGLTVAFTGLEARAAGDVPTPKSVDWSFSGPFGKFDRGQLQRGYKVYQEVCKACHGMKLLSYRNLGEPGGPEFSEEAVKAIAASVEVTDGPNDDGEMFERPAKPADAFKSPFSNDAEARVANNGALPPDLSVMAKARPGGANYLYSLLTGYQDAPSDVKMTEGMNYNAYFPGHQIAMANPLSDEAVDYTDGTKPTVDNYAKDVTAFMMWAAEPKLEERHRVGFRVMIYLLFLTVFLYLAKRRVWSNLDH